MLAARAEGEELSLVLVADQRMRALNRRYRKKDRTTDVLAFPLQRVPLTLQGRGKKIGDGKRKRCQTPFPPALLGDVVISMETAKRQAASRGHSLRDELTRLLIHGVLHLMGYDHERSERDATIMARKERAVLRAIRGRKK